jgi:hypothetical protein
VNEWVEERAAAIRLALRIPGFPEEADLYRLIDWLDGCVVLRWAEVSAGYCVHREDHRGVITLPRRVPDREVDRILAEEIGHYLLTHGMAALLRQMAPEDARILRLARRWEWRDEVLAREFVQAWHLPSRLVQETPDDEELAFQSRCTLALVEERRGSLQGRVIELSEPPRWCAGRHYRLVQQVAGRRPCLHVLGGGSEQPGFTIDLPAGLRDEDLRASAFQVTADLAALTPDEFGIKYEPFRCSGAERVEIDLAELRAWAGQVKAGE